MTIKSKMHKFSYKGFIKEKEVFRVDCTETGGHFCTSIWNQGKCQFNKCPCCGKDIEKKKRRKFSKW